MTTGAPERYSSLILICCLLAPLAPLNVLAQPTPFPPGQVVVGPIGNTSGPALPSITTGADANIYTGSIEGGFIPTAAASVVRTSTPTQFVRFYNRNNYDTLGPPAFPWIATTNSVRGLTAAQIKNILALPDLPTSAAIVRVPAGTCILGGPGNPALGNFPADPPSIPTPGPWGAAGAPQYYIVGKNEGAGCADPQDLPSSSFIIQSDLGTYALAYGPNAGGGNARAVAAALDQASFPAPFTPMDGVYNSLDLLNFTDPALLRSALGQLSGEMNADLVSVGIESGRIFMGAVGRRLRGQLGGAAVQSGGEAAIADGRIRAWLDTSGGSVSIDGDGNTHDFGMDIGAVVGGMDYEITPKLKLGGALGYAYSASSTHGVLGDGSATSYYMALYGGYSDGPFYVDAIAGYGLSRLDASRWISFPGQQGTPSGRTTSQAFISTIETGYGFQVSNDISIAPIGGIQVISLWQYAFSESGAGPLDLDVADKALVSLRSLLGLDISHELPIDESNGLHTQVRLAWAHELAGTDRTISQSFQQLEGSDFHASGAEPSRDAAVVSVGLATRGPIKFFFRYDGFYSSVQQGHVGTAGLAVGF
jgi:uncharacterized protein YhjY with autotransporter beta-barrel domain